MPRDDGNEQAQHVYKSKIERQKGVIDVWDETGRRCKYDPKSKKMRRCEKRSLARKTRRFECARNRDCPNLSSGRIARSEEDGR